MAVTAAVVVLVVLTLTKLTHRLKVLLFSVADVAPDLFINSKHELLGRRQDSDCVQTLRNIQMSMVDVFNLKSTDNRDYLPFASCDLNLLVHVPAHGHQHHGVIRRMLQDKMTFSSRERCRYVCPTLASRKKKLTSQLDPNVPSE